MAATSIDTPMERPDAKRRSFNWPLLGARITRALWNITIKLALGIIYFVFISQGLRNRFPDSGATKLYTIPIPLIAHLEDFEATYQLDVAHLGAVTILLLSWLSWNFAIRWVISDELKDLFRKWKWNLEWVKSIIFNGAIFLIVGDAALFYDSFNYAVFRQSKVSASALLGTLVYVVILVTVNFVSIYFAQCVKDLKQEK